MATMISLAIVPYHSSLSNLSLQKEKIKRSSLRSCLKSSRSKKKLRSVRFANVGRRYYVQNKRVDGRDDEFDRDLLWTIHGHAKHCSKRDALIAETDKAAEIYNKIHDASYQLMNNNETVPQYVFSAMVKGVGMGYRSIEVYSEDSIERSQRQDQARSSIVEKYWALDKEQDDWDTELCNHSEKLSLGTRRWACWMGRVDQAAASQVHNMVFTNTVSLGVESDGSESEEENEQERKQAVHVECKSVHPQALSGNNSDQIRPLRNKNRFLFWR